jgi:hypothetical protein
MFPLTIAFGLAVVVAICVSPLFAPRLRRMHSGRLGAAFVICSVGVVLVALARRTHPDSRMLFLGAFAALLVGAILLLADDQTDGDDGYGDADDPPWWPEFESSFRRYAARSRRPVSR